MRASRQEAAPYALLGSPPRVHTQTMKLTYLASRQAPNSYSLSGSAGEYYETCRTEPWHPDKPPIPIVCRAPQANTMKHVVPSLGIPTGGFPLYLVGLPSPRVHTQTMKLTYLASQQRPNSYSLSGFLPRILTMKLQYLASRQAHNSYSLSGSLPRILKLWSLTSRQEAAPYTLLGSPLLVCTHSNYETTVPCIPTSPQFL